MRQLPLDNINFKPLDIWSFASGITPITDLIYFDSDPLYTDNALITNRGTNGINGTAYSAHVIDFNGTNAYTTVTTDFDTWDSTESFQIDIWVNPDSLAALSTLFNTDDNRISVFTTSTGTVGVQIREDGTNGFDQRTTTTIVVDKWQELSIRYDGSETVAGITFFVDDVAMTKAAATQDNFSTTFGSVASASFGAYDVSGTAAQFYNGQQSNQSITINGTLAHSWEMMEGKELLTFDSVTGIAGSLVNATWITRRSGLENGETHNGLPQNLTRKWNGYTLFTGNDDGKYYALTGIGGSSFTGYTELTFRFKARFKNFLNNEIFFGTATNAAASLCYAQTKTSNDVEFKIVGVKAKSGSLAVNIEHDLLCTIRLTGGNLELKVYTDGVSTGTDTGASAEIDLSFILANWGIGNAGNLSVNKFQGFIYDIEIFEGYTSDGTLAGLTKIHGYLGSDGYVDDTGSVDGTPINNPERIPIPENPNNLGFDTFGNAITPSGDTFRFDELSHIDGNTPITVDWDTPFELELIGVRFNELGSQEILFENLDSSTSFRGLQINKNSSNNIGVLFCNNNATNTKLFFTSTTGMVVGVNYDIRVTHNGTGVLSGFDLLINNVSEAKASTEDALGGNTTITTNNVNIGRRRSSNNLKFNGTIQDIKFKPII